MASKQTKRKTKGSKRTVKTPRNVWSAGIDTLSVARERGQKLLGNLLIESGRLNAQVTRFAKEVGADGFAQAKGSVRAVVEANVQKARDAMQSGVAAVLKQLGIPSKADVEALSRSVAALSRKLKTAR